MMAWGLVSWAAAVDAQSGTGGQAVPQASTAPAQKIRLAAGGQREVSLGRPIERIAIGAPEVADAVLLDTRGDATRVLVVAHKAGATDLMIWPRSGPPVTYAIQVDALPLDRRAASMEVMGQGATIRGSTPDGATAMRTRDAARVAVGAAGIVADSSELPVPGTVQVDVRVIEISKTVLKEVGFNFYRNHSGFAFGSFSPTSLRSVGFTPGSGVSVDSSVPISSAFNLVAASVTNGIFANLSLLESNGMARVLAEPSLVALSGQSASFLAGGEIPIPVPQALGTVTIQYKPFGIGLTVTPTVISASRIALKVAPEASDLDPSRGTSLNGTIVPAIITRRADTTVELGDGESFVIGGLVSRNISSNIDKVPFLGDLPLIGVFFKNLQFHQDDRELMIVVTPRLVRPLASGSAAVAATRADDRVSDNPNVWGKTVMGQFVNPALPGFSR